jgi:hypothetical protein
VGAAPLVVSIAIGVHPEEASQLLLSESVVVTSECPGRMPMQCIQHRSTCVEMYGNLPSVSSRAICGHLGRKGGFLLSRPASRSTCALMGEKAQDRRET